MTDYFTSLVMLNSLTKFGAFLVTSTFILMISTSNLIPDRRRAPTQEKSAYQRLNRLIYYGGWTGFLSGVVLFIVGILLAGGN